jgi:hypothetical protein
MQTIRLATLTFMAFTSAVISTGAQSVIYNSFGPGNSYDSGVVWAVSGASESGGYRGQAEFFTPSISGYLNTIELATYHVSGSPLSNFFIAQDNGGGSPGTILETFSNVTNPSGLLTLHSTPGVLLQAGTEYWLADEPATATSYNGWYENSQNVANGFAFERSEWSWAAIGPPAPDSGVFEVTVTPVPEPSAAQLALIGGCCSLVFWRYRKNDSRRGSNPGC